MNNKRRNKIRIVAVCDLFCVILSLYLALDFCASTSYKISLESVLASNVRVSTIVTFFLMLAVCRFTFVTFGLYRSRRLSKYRDETADVVKATTVYVICFAIVSYINATRAVTSQAIAAFWILGILILSSERLMIRLIVAGLRSSGNNLRYVLILGTNYRAIEFAARISEDREFGCKVLGFVDDEWPGMPSRNELRFQLVSNINGLEEYLRRNIVDEVAIYLPFGSYYKHSAYVADLCGQHGITMRFDTDIFGLKSSQWRAEAIGNDNYIATYTTVRDEFWPRFTKRAIDVTVGSIALLACSPILILTSIAIRVSSPGPILFLQERIGFNKRRFKIFKFRTMVHNAERLMPALEKMNEASGPVFKIRNDPRISSIGKFLRKSSIDELPQLVNVIKGEMSLVGPRPIQLRDFNSFDEDWQRRRFSVKPGMTCLWQVNGRSDISFHQWMLLDLQYLDEWSVWLDIKILAKTVPAVLRGSGAA